jgi:Arc/MetJ-type ribon-helix-helix transcriptional regulator
MSQIAVRLDNNDLSALDSMVDGGDFHSRAEAVRAGIRLLDRELRERRITDSYRVAYQETPLTPDELTALDAAVALAGDALS